MLVCINLPLKLTRLRISRQRRTYTLANIYDRAFLAKIVNCSKHSQCSFEGHANLHKDAKRKSEPSLESGKQCTVKLLLMTYDNITKKRSFLRRRLDQNRRIWGKNTCRTSAKILVKNFGFLNLIEGTNWDHTNSDLSTKVWDIHYQQMQFMIMNNDSLQRRI